MKVIYSFLFLILCCEYGVHAQQTVTQSILDYPQNAFDSDTCCWRTLYKAKKFNESANLIVYYLTQSKNVKNKHSLNWHAGQLFATGGDYKLAKQYFNKTYSIFTKLFGGEDGKLWYYFAKANIAFLERDLKEFERITELWKLRYPVGTDLYWKDKNYQALMDLYNFWDFPYGFESTRKL